MRAILAFMTIFVIPAGHILAAEPVRTVEQAQAEARKREATREQSARQTRSASVPLTRDDIRILRNGNNNEKADRLNQILDGFSARLGQSFNLEERAYIVDFVTIAEELSQSTDGLLKALALEASLTAQGMLINGITRGYGETHLLHVKVLGELAVKKSLAAAELSGFFKEYVEKKKEFAIPLYLETLFALDPESSSVQMTLVGALNARYGKKTQIKAFELLKRLPKLQVAAVLVLLGEVMEASEPSAARFQNFPVRLLVYFNLNTKPVFMMLEGFLAELAKRKMPARPDIEWALKQLKKGVAGICVALIDGTAQANNDTNYFPPMGI